MKKDTNDRFQINVRVSKELLDAIDSKRASSLVKDGSIPSRAEIIKQALEKFLISDDKP